MSDAATVSLRSTWPSEGSVSRVSIPTSPVSNALDQIGAQPIRTTFICGDVFTTDLQPASFDLVAASAVLHHIDARAGLRRMRHLVRPGGVVAVVGFGRPTESRDRLLEVAGAGTKQLRVVRRQYWEHNAPISWPPPFTTGQMCELGREELHGASFRRLMSNCCRSLKFPSCAHRNSPPGDGCEGSSVRVVSLLW